jgi:transposase
METEIGCDISMDWIDVCVLEPPRHFRIANKPKPVERLARELPPGSRIGMEATGTMHQLLADAMCAAGHTVYELNPRWVHRYAGGVGVRGKSDRSDAMLIARYVHAERAHLHPYRSPTPQQREIRDAPASPSAGDEAQETRAAKAWETRRTRSCRSSSNS